MTNQGIFAFAMIVFTLMLIGLGLTILEFRASMADMRAGSQAVGNNAPSHSPD